MTFQDYLKPRLDNALKALGIEDPNCALELPKNPEHGDLATNVAMVYAKKLGLAPRALAEKLLSTLEYEANVIRSMDIAGPGFINFSFQPEFTLSLFAEALQQGDTFGKGNIGNNKKVNVEFVSANPTGLLHLGHARQAAVGACVATIYEWNGYSVEREYYFNNAGNQMNMLGRSIYARYRQVIGEESYPFPEDGYHGEYIKDIAAQLLEQYGTSLAEETVEHLAIARSEGEKWCFASIKQTLQRMGVSHDIFFNEDSLYKDGKVTETVEKLRERGLVYEKDGATWFELTKLGREQDKVIIKSSGEPTYRLPDIAYHCNKFERGADIVVDIFGADHIATIPDVRAGVEALGYSTEGLKVLILQFVTLFDGGKPVKMSKRTGRSFTVDDLLDEVGADVSKYFFLMRGINTHLEFDLALAREQSEKNPVFYVQYAHARIASLLRNAVEQGFVPATEHAAVQQLTAHEEQDLIKTSLRFPEVVAKAGQILEPQIIAEYLREVATAFHKFYHEHSILKAESAELVSARLALCLLAKRALANGLTILGVSAPESM